MKIPILTNDPSFTAWGMARLLLDVDTLEMELQELILIETEKTKEKRTRVTSDDLVRAAKLYTGFQKAARGVHAIFSEIPSGAQDARSARSFGIVVGILASAPIPITQVMPLETKAVVEEHATKAKMIAAMHEKYPHPTWLRDRDKPDGRLLAKNEHLADALAVGEAGILTDEFRRSLAMTRRIAA